ncbi:MAG: anhydro-N-acetylmuramic acid kinase [Flavobacteriaceae bacterium]|nr:anhydro-N-acetylmuramic acid kinase [Flavobacteriaceae bacterium]
MAVVIGLMSGTSLDGLDICCARFSKNLKDFQILAYATIPYTLYWREKLENAFYNSSTELDQLDKEYGEFLGHAVADFLPQHKLPKVDLISSHGHTVFHDPEKGITKQIGSGSEIAKKTGIPVVYDFRSQDVGLGGQGAPLVPVGDALLFPQYDACVNLGGFTNISFDQNKQRIAYDICACNIVLNHFAQLLGKPFDHNGTFAKQGIVHLPLLEKLNALDYYKKTGPKSLAREFSEQKLLPMMSNLHEKDILHTYTKHIGFQIGKAITESDATSCLISGGGVYNRFLIEQIKKNAHCLIEIPKKQLIDTKEALVFALLGHLRFKNQINVWASVTGAKKDHSAGQVVFP